MVELLKSNGENIFVDRDKLTVEDNDYLNEPVKAEQKTGKDNQKTDTVSQPSILTR